VPGKASGIKDGGGKGGEHQLVWMGWQSIPIVDGSACFIFILHQKIHKMARKDTIFGYHPVATPTIPTCLCKQELGKPSQNAAQPCTREQGCDNDDLRADGLQKGWDFGSVPGLLTH